MTSSVLYFKSLRFGSRLGDLWKNFSPQHRLRLKSIVELSWVKWMKEIINLFVTCWRDYNERDNKWAVGNEIASHSIRFRSPAAELGNLNISYEWSWCVCKGLTHYNIIATITHISPQSDLSSINCSMSQRTPKNKCHKCIIARGFFSL